MLIVPGIVEGLEAILTLMEHPAAMTSSAPWILHVPEQEGIILVGKPVALFLSDLSSTAGVFIAPSA